MDNSVYSLTRTADRQMSPQHANGHENRSSQLCARCKLAIAKMMWLAIAYCIKCCCHTPEQLFGSSVPVYWSEVEIRGLLVRVQLPSVHVRESYLIIYSRIISTNLPVDFHFASMIIVCFLYKNKLLKLMKPSHKMFFYFNYCIQLYIV